MNSADMTTQTDSGSLSSPIGQPDLGDIITDLILRRRETPSEPTAADILDEVAFRPVTEDNAQARVPGDLLRADERRLLVAAIKAHYLSADAHYEFRPTHDVVYVRGDRTMRAVCRFERDFENVTIRFNGPGIRNIVGAIQNGMPCFQQEDLVLVQENIEKELLLVA